MSLFKNVAFIGIGLIGSSLARVMRRDGLAEHITVCARSQETLDAAMELGLCDVATADIALAVNNADLVMLCTPIGAYGAVAKSMAASLKAGCIVSDVGSTKESVITDVKPYLPAGVQLVPGHPIAGTEHSGPAAGFAELFENHWCLITPEDDTDPAAVEKITAMWQAAGMKVEAMDAKHHDRVLAITSHLPHLIAYTIVDTAVDLEEDTKREVVKYSAGGFRDFTRIAASDPVMWRDIFLNNKGAVLEILERFTDDLSAMKTAIENDDGDSLQDAFTRTREIRRGVIELRQDKIDAKPTK